MAKVDFMIIGAQKCATTTLFRILTRHPDIDGPRVKEPHFFSTTPDWRRNLPQYEALFDDRRGGLCCEASTSYTFYPHRNLEIWEDLHAYNPALKFIYLVRDPVDRIVSSYMHNLARGYTRLSIEQLVTSRSLLLDTTRYYTQIIPFIRRFGRDRVLILDFQDFLERRRDTVEKVTRFLGVNITDLTDFEDVHANKSVGGRKHHHRFDDPPFMLEGVRRLSPGLWRRIVDRYSPTVNGPPRLSPEFERMIGNVLDLEIRELETLLEKDLDHWRRKAAQGTASAAPAEGGLELVG